MQQGAHVPDAPAPTEAQSPGLSSLTSAVLDLEAERQERQNLEATEVVYADDLLPGVGEERITLAAGLQRYGRRTLVVLALLAGLDNLQGSALATLSPDIQRTFHVSSGAIVFLTSASGAFLVFGILPMGWLADRLRRGRIIGWAAFAFGAMVAATGAAVNIFTMFLARFGSGVSQASTFAVNGPLLADTYPIGLRGRIAAVNGFATGLAGALSPLLAGGIASLAGGGAGWRWSFVLLGLPVVALGWLAFRLPEPPRGQFEKQTVVGSALADEKPPPISVEAAFARLMRIRTIKTSVLAFSAVGFGLFTGPVLGNLFLEQHFHLNAFHRGLVGTISGLAVLLVLPFAGRYYDRLYRESPTKALRLVAILILPAAALTPVQYFMPNVVLFVIVGLPQTVALLLAFTLIGPVLTSVSPYRLRGLGAALGSLYVFFVGATGGALLGALLTNSFGPRTAMLALIIPSTIVGGGLLLRSASSIRSDLSLVVQELQEELAEHERQHQSPELIPALQVSGVDFAYGQVQILFDVDFEVRKGEVLALLGTNGAGKSTILRVIAGLGTPSRGVIRLHGQTITFASPEQRVRMGIQLLPGGRGVFPDMSVADNLLIGAFQFRKDPQDRSARMERVLDLFPDLREKFRVAASELSGGQQQMLALARTLMHDPEVLIIDELSLGLAPIIVQQLIGVIEQLRRDGMTVLIVEQSLNVAAAVADRAVFLEKGRVRFEGAVSELMSRGDLARAVFLGGAVETTGAPDPAAAE
jgi:ABC-type branched-subunit amino acid transport system ATPase component/predicted MFS family arabinose efflux permease